MVFNTSNTQSHGDRFPPGLIWAVAIICVSPAILMLLGVNFGSQAIPLNLEELTGMLPVEQVELIFSLNSGALTHTILEWSAFTVAISTVLLAFAHYRITNDITTPIIAAALFCSGIMDAFHTLAADRLITAMADNQLLIPFTWAISRSFNAIIMILGVGILLFSGHKKMKITLSQASIISAGFLIISYAIIHYCATSTSLPRTMFPDSLITRPWDVGPLVLYLFAGLWLFPLYYRKKPSVFSFSLIIAMIPDVFTEMHMAFGSTALYDAHFNVAHFLKILAYVVPFLGLVLDYIHTYEKQIHADLEKSKYMDSLGLISRITKLANKSSNVGEVLEQALSEICRYIKWPVGHVYRLDLKTEKMVPTDLWRIVDEENYEEFKKITHSAEFSSGFDLPGMVLETYMPYWVEDLSANDTFYRTTVNDLQSLKSGFVLPVVINGKVRYALEFFTPVRVKVDKILFGFLSDVGSQISRVVEREESLIKHIEEKELRIKAESISRGILDNVADGVISIDDNGKIVTMNPAAEDIFGYEQNELIGRNVKVLMPTPHQDRHDYYLNQYYITRDKKLIGKGRELIGLRKNGKSFPMDLSVSELRFDGSCIFTGIVRDITKRKEDEESLINQGRALQRSNEELERFAYVASHDLQEPLRMVASYTNLLSRRYKDKLDDEANEFINFAVDGATRMQGLIRDLLAFSRINSKGIDQVVVDCNEILAGIVHDFSILIEESNCKVTVGELPNLVAEKSQIRQLFQNLVNNAIKYSGGAKLNEISISAVQKNKHWQFAISDTGIGIEEKHFKEIFDIFRRLHSKASYAGTGLGLAVCKRIVDIHHGEIWVESEYGKGSTFYFTLPFNE